MMEIKKIITQLNELIAKNYYLDYYQTKKLLKSHNITSFDVRYQQSIYDNSLQGIALVENSKNRVQLLIGKKSWVDYLPSIYEDNALLIQFLFGFQLTQLQQKETVDNISSLFIPEETKFIDWLFEWFGIKFGSYIDDEAKRRYLYQFVTLHKKRGTKLYLVELVQILTEQSIEIKEFSDYKFSVVLNNEKTLENLKKEELCQVISKIIKIEKPAFTIFLGIENCKHYSAAEVFSEPVFERNPPPNEIEVNANIDKVDDFKHNHHIV